MRVSATPDRLELEFRFLEGGCLAAVVVLAGSPLLVAALRARSAGPSGALEPAALGLAAIAFLAFAHWLTRARCVLDRPRNELRLERKGLAPGDGLLPLDAIERAEVVVGGDAEGTAFYKPALRVRGRREPLLLAGFGSATSREADEAVRVIEEWLGRAG